MINNIMRLSVSGFLVSGVLAIWAATILMRYDIIYFVIMLYVILGVVHVVITEKYLDSDESTDLEQRMMRLMPFDWRLLLIVIWPYIWLR